MTNLENFLKNKKILYTSVPLIICLFLYIVYMIFNLIFSIYPNPAFFMIIYALVITISFMKGIPFIVRRLNLKPHDDWKNYLQSKELKIPYYKFVIKILKLWSFIAELSILFILTGLLIVIIKFAIAIPNNALEIKTFILELSNITPSTDIIIVLALLFLGLGWIGFFGVTMWGLFFFYLILPHNKVSDFPEDTDIPISFIEMAIKEVNSFDFSLVWEERQQKKIRISNLINNALEFIIPRAKLFGIPNGVKYQAQFIGDINNNSQIIDILYRTNGLSVKLNEIVVRLNCLKTDEDKEEIANNLIKYLYIIKNRDLCEIEPVPYTEQGLILGIVKKLEPILYISRLISKN